MGGGRGVGSVLLILSRFMLLVVEFFKFIVIELNNFKGDF